MTRTPREDEASFPADAGGLVDRRLFEVPLDRLEADPDQPRKFFATDAMLELKNSVREHGVLQPVIFRRDEQGRLLVVAGERRLRAAREAGISTIPAIYRENVDAAEVSLVENLLRENLNPIEEAEALQRLRDVQNYTQEQISEVIGKAVSTISEILSLNRLPEEVKAECRESARYSRRSLVEIAKGEDEEEMLALFEKYKSMELKRDGVRGERRSGNTRQIDWVKALRKFRKQLDRLDLDEKPKRRAALEKEINLVVTALQEKIGGGK